MDPRYGSMSMGGQTHYIPQGGAMGNSGYSNSNANLYSYVDELRRKQQEQEAAARQNRGGDIGLIIQQMARGPQMGGAVDGGARDIAGMRGAAGPQGPGVRGYYRFGAIPTGSNSEVIKPQYYDYSGTPDPAKMTQNPWDPTRWDPNNSFTPGNRSPGGARGQGSRRREKRLGRRLRR